MPNNISESKDLIGEVVIKKSSLFRRLKNYFPHSNKKLIILVLITLAIPVTVGLALVQQEIRSRADQGDRKIFLGMATKTSHREATMQNVQEDLEKIKTETGAYPAVYHFFNNLDNSIPSLEILNYLDSKEITPMISLMPVGSEMERRDGRFIFSSTTGLSTGAFPAGQLKFDSSNASAVTKIYVSKTASETENPAALVSTWVPGAKISVFGTRYYKDKKGNDMQGVDYDNPNHFDFNVNSKMDKGDYWEVGVTETKAGTLTGIFANAKPVFITMADTLGKNWGNSKIAEGTLDDRFVEFAQRAKEFNKPIILRYAWEMDGTWFPWSAGKRDTRISYDRYRYFDMGNTKRNYVASWRHIYNLIKPIAPNVKFNWCSGGSPDADYFPGDDYVDYVGFDTYSGIGNSQHNSLINLSNGPVNALRRLSGKKIIIGETGINTTRKQIPEDQFPAYRKNWIKDGYLALYNLSPNLAGIIYFNLDARFAESMNNWLMSDDPEISSVYRTLLLNPKFQGRFENRSPISTPTPPAEDFPYGNHDSASCTNITGWACDGNNYQSSVEVKLYADAPKGEGRYLGAVIADTIRESAVAAECGGVNNHGFNFNTPESIKDGTTHRIYAYAVDDQDKSVNSRLSSSPKVVSCAGNPPSPTPTPPDQTGCIRKLPAVSYKDTSKSGKRKETAIYKITIRNNDVNCKERKIAFDLVMPTTRWSYSPEFITLARNETKTVDFKVTSGPYSSFGVKNLDLTIVGAYKPHPLFDVQTLQYNVVK